MAKLIDKGATATGKRWVVRYREPGGRTARQREKSFDRKRDALDFATKVENDKRENTYVDPTAGRVSVSQYAESWLASKVGAPGTLVGYEQIMRLHVLPHLGNKPMAKVTAADVEALFARWRHDGAKPNTIACRRIALSGLFSHAARHKRIATNPVREAQAPQAPVVSVDERALPSFEEISALAEKIGPRLEPCVWLMACCGLRIGESLGVFPEDIRDGTLRLRRQVTLVKDTCGKYVAQYAPLKHRSEGEWRDIPAPAILDPFHRSLPVRSARGGMTHPGLVRKSWDAAIARLGLPPYKPHDLRHKWATITLSNGAALHEVSRWLGHRSVNVTADLYGHLTQDGRERCRQIITSSFAQHVPVQPANPAAPGAGGVLSSC
ncbi:tyrosine-type recombinase/integrase [Streptomyces violens]|uniref:tyrosine-type recombinase/integrase n=1 Tax=Streptomyces violens TaxID=66377 RepID=UPI0004BEE423|nr:site-specific integrase [Streptomyces violens]